MGGWEGNWNFVNVYDCDSPLIFFEYELSTVHFKNRTRINRGFKLLFPR